MYMIAIISCISLIAALVMNKITLSYVNNVNSIISENEKQIKRTLETAESQTTVVYYGSVNDSDNDESFVEDIQSPINSPLHRLYSIYTRCVLILNSLSNDYWILTFIHGLYITIFHSANNFMPHYLMTYYHIDIFNAGVISSLTSSFAIFITPIAGCFVDKLSNQLLVCFVAAIFTTLGYIGLLFTSISPVVSILGVALGISLLPLITLAYLTKIIPKQRLGVAFSLVEILDGVSFIFGNMCFGMLYDITGNYFWSMITILLLSLIGLFLIAFEYFNNTSRYRLNFDTGSDINKCEHKELQLQETNE